MAQNPLRTTFKRIAPALALIGLTAAPLAASGNEGKSSVPGEKVTDTAAGELTPMQKYPPMQTDSPAWKKMIDDTRKEAQETGFAWLRLENFPDDNWQETSGPMGIMMHIRHNRSFRDMSFDDMESYFQTNVPDLDAIYLRIFTYESDKYPEKKQAAAAHRDNIKAALGSLNDNCERPIIVIEAPTLEGSCYSHDHYNTLLRMPIAGMKEKIEAAGMYAVYQTSSTVEFRIGNAKIVDFVLDDAAEPEKLATMKKFLEKLVNVSNRQVQAANTKVNQSSPAVSMGN